MKVQKQVNTWEIMMERVVESNLAHLTATYSMKYLLWGVE